MSERQLFSETERRRFRPYPKYKDSGVEWLGEIPVHWEVKRLKRLFLVVNGSTPQSGVVDYWNGDIPWVTPEDLGELQGSVIQTTRRRITKAGYRSCGTTLVPAGSLVLSTRAPIGYLAIGGLELCTNQGCRSMVFRRELNRKFFHFQLLAARSELESWGQGSTFKELARSKLEEMRIAEPPETEQRAIAAFLDRETAKIDALIAKKEQLIELLQEKRTALISQAVTKGLDPKAPMKDSGVEWLGKIPAHWDLLRLKYLSSINDEVLNEKTEPRFELIYVDIGGVDQYQGIVSTEELVFETAPSRARRIVREGDVIISTVRTYLRAIAPIKHPESNLIVSTGFAVIRPSSALDCNFAPYALRASNFVESIVANSAGVSYPAIDTSKMSCFVMATPDIEEQQEIAAFLDHETAKIDALVAKIHEAIDRLKEYRTALISAAVTGKIDVRDTRLTS